MRSYTSPPTVSLEPKSPGLEHWASTCTSEAGHLRRELSEGRPVGVCGVHDRHHVRLIRDGQSCDCCEEPKLALAIICVQPEVIQPRHCLLCRLGPDGINSTLRARCAQPDARILIHLLQSEHVHRSNWAVPFSGLVLVLPPLEEASAELEICALPPRGEPAMPLQEQSPSYRLWRPHPWRRLDVALQGAWRKPLGELPAEVNDLCGARPDWDTTPDTSLQDHLHNFPILYP